MLHLSGFSSSDSEGTLGTFAVHFGRRFGTKLGGVLPFRKRLSGAHFALVFLATPGFLFYRWGVLPGVSSKYVGLLGLPLRRRNHSIFPFFLGIQK